MPSKSTAQLIQHFADCLFGHKMSVDSIMIFISIANQMPNQSIWCKLNADLEMEFMASDQMVPKNMDLSFGNRYENYM